MKKYLSTVSKCFASLIVVMLAGYACQFHHHLDDVNMELGKKPDLAVYSMHASVNVVFAHLYASKGCRQKEIPGKSRWLYRALVQAVSFAEQDELSELAYFKLNNLQFSAYGSINKVSRLIPIHQRFLRLCMLLI